MRIGTWNLEGAWSADHGHVMTEVDADLWLLTEVRPRVALDGYQQQLTRGLAPDGSHWAGILSRHPVDRLPDPHPASVAARAEGVLVCSSVLPWPFAGAETPWDGQGTYAEAMALTLAAVETTLKTSPAVWGGTWHQPLAGNIVGFSPRVQEALLGTIDLLGLQVPTAHERTRHGRGRYTVDHLAVPAAWEIVERGSFAVDQASEHDAYWVEVEVPSE